MRIPITASMLYDLVQCPHRVTLDLFGDESKKDPENAGTDMIEIQFENDPAIDNDN